MAKLDKHLEELIANQSEDKQMAMFYGDAFTGKTHAAAAFANAGYNLIWININERWKSMLNAVEPQNRGNIDIINIADTPQNSISFNTVYRLTTGNKVKIFDEDGSVGNVALAKAGAPQTEYELNTLSTKDILVIDSWTALSDAVMNQYIKINSDIEFKQPEFKHWSSQGMYLLNTFVKLRRLPCHVIIISHEEEIEQEDGSNRMTPVGGSRNFAKKGPRKVDHVVHFRTNMGKFLYNADTLKNPKVISGSCSALKIETLEDLTQIFRTSDGLIKKMGNKK